MQPFPQELKDLCFKHPEFLEQLKLVWPDRFVSLLSIISTESPLVPSDEVIGFWVLDYSGNKPLFKEDYIVDVGKQKKEFHLYTGRKTGNGGKYIHNMTDFTIKYGGNGQYYANSHHATYDQLAPDLIPHADRPLKIAEMWRNLGVKIATQEELEEISSKLTKLGM
jgi:hypothetical protein